MENSTGQIEQQIDFIGRAPGPETQTSAEETVNILAAQAPKRKRGRPAKPAAAPESFPLSATPQPEKKKVDIDGLSFTLVTLTGFLAGMSKVPEIQFDKEEAEQLASAYDRVQRHYEWAIAEKSTDWANLIIVTGGIFGAKIFAFKARKAEEREAHMRRAAPRPAATVQEKKPETENETISILREQSVF